MNDTPLYPYSNKSFIEKLSKFKNRDVLLLLLDGSAAFGRIERIDDWTVTLLPATSIPEQTFVQLCPAAFADQPILTSQLFIDSRSILHFVESSFILSPLSPLATPVSPSPPTIPKTESNAPIPARQYCELAEELQELAGKNIAIMTLGRWILGGKFIKTERSISLITAGDSLLPPFVHPNRVTIFGAVFPLGLDLSIPPVRIWSNLKALTQIIVP